MKKIKSVLLVEDDRIIGMNITVKLREVGIDVKALCSSYNESVKFINQNEVDVLICDIFLKGDKTGIDVAKYIRKKKNIPVIFISQTEDEQIAVEAVEIDPVTYLPKPFTKAALLAALKMAEAYVENKEVINDRFLYNFDEKQIFDTEENILIPLSKQEIDVIEIMLKERKNGKNIPYQAVENAVWGDDSANATTRRALVSRINTKVGEKLIKAVSKVGYRFEE